MRALKISGNLLLLLLLSACTSVGERTQISVGYYDIKGTTFSELDQQILLHGPTVKGVGKALAATNIKMEPNIRFSRLNGKCRLTKIRVKVKARVTLPRLTNRKNLTKKLRNAWNNLEEYARLHEAVHVAIADHHALEIEKALAALPPAEDCEKLRTNAQDLAATLLEKHQQEQLRFDASEKQRIEKLTGEKSRSAGLKP